MKRDMELIRLLLLQMESDEEPPELKKYDTATLGYNAALLVDAGLVEGSVTKDNNGMPVGAVLLHLTWAGHDFLDSARDPKIWRLAKEKVLKPGISFTFTLLAEYLKNEARKQLLGA